MLRSLVWYERRGSLRFRWLQVMELVDHLGYLPWHGQVYMGFVIFPVECQAHVERSGPVVGDLV